MASLLVYLDAARLDELVAQRVDGAKWAIRPGELPQPQLDQLDEHGLLVVLTIQAGKAIAAATLTEPQREDGVFAGGDAILHDVDLSHLLPRLGCRDVAELPAWARIPRILPPGDVDLLSYALQLELAIERPAEQLAPPDPVAESLRAAALADPRSDDARTIYADRLQDLGDPRGELIALQIARARSGGPVSEREAALIPRFAADCAQPLTRYLTRGFELRRGFVAACVVDERVAMPEEILANPAWSTVEQLETRNFALLTSPSLVSLTRACIDGRELGRLAAHPRPLPFEVIVGPTTRVGRRTLRTGIYFDDLVGWRGVMRIGALQQLRVLSLDLNIPMPGFHAQFRHGLVGELLHSPLGKALRQLDLHVRDPHAEAVAWRQEFDDTGLPRLTIRYAVDPATPPICIALERGSPHRLVVQLDEPLLPAHITAVLRLIAPLSRGLRQIELHDLGFPTLVADRQRALIARLGAMFSQIVTPTRCEPLAPGVQ